MANEAYYVLFESHLRYGFYEELPTPTKNGFLNTPKKNLKMPGRTPLSGKLLINT